MIIRVRSVGICGTDGRVRVEPLITHNFPLKEMERAFAVMQSKQCMKIIMHP